MASSDQQLMVEALSLAKEGLFSTHPNPCVGCIIIDADNKVARGFHRFCGAAHAEIEALRDARQKGLDLKTATVFVTLEPCVHQGKTGPCTEALIEAGVQRVVVAMKDPNPLVAGKGIQALEAAGIKVELGLEEARARAINRGFIKRMEKGLPYVSLKMAMSLDGRTAMASGESQWITGDLARHDVQLLRAQSSAIMTGIDTVLHDNPRMTVRVEEARKQYQQGFAIRQPKIVLVDAMGKLPADCQLMQRPEQLIWVTGPQMTTSNEVLTHIHVPLEDSHCQLKATLIALAQQEINELLVETGPRLAGALMQADLVDELVIYMAPRLLGDQAKPLMVLPGLTRLGDTPKLRLCRVQTIGDDVKLLYQK